MKRTHNRTAWAVLLTLAVLGGAAGSAVAQTSTATVTGIVSDEAGAAIAGASVLAIDSESGYQREVTTGADGSYSLAGLPPGTYDIVITAEKRAPQQAALRVQVGQSLNANFKLGTAEVFTEGITVVGDGYAMETKTPEIATNVSREQIANLPQLSRNFLSFAALAPGVQFTADQDAQGKTFRAGGMEARQVNVFVDGLSYKNDLLQGGAFMQDSSRGNPFPQNAVQEFRVLTQNFKAEYEKAASAVITAVTKSGGNTLHGDAFYLFQDQSMVTQDDFSKARNEKKPDFSRKEYGVSIGGPIIQDRLHYFASYEAKRQDRFVSIFRGGQFDSAPANVRNLLGQYPLGTLTAPFSSDLFFGKLSWQPGTGQTVDISAHMRDEKDVLDFGGNTVEEGATSFEVGTEVLAARHQWVLGNALNEASLTTQNLQWNPTSENPATPRQVYIGILTVGGRDATQNFEQKKIGLRDDLSYLASWRGSHALKTGLGVNRLDYNIDKQLFNNPLFEFRQDEQWQFPFQARLGFGDSNLDFSNTQVGIFAQDDWQFSPRLTLNLGLRWDYESNMINNDYQTPPALATALQNACQTYGQPVGGRTTWCLRDFLDLNRYTTDGSDRDPYLGMVQPRVGFSYDVRGDSKTILFGGWGKYYDRVILNDIFDEQYRQSWALYNFCFSADGTPAPNCGAPTIAWKPEYLSAAGLRGLIASGAAGSKEVWLVANDMKPPRSDQWTLGVRQQFGAWLTSLSYANTRGYNGLVMFFGDRPPGVSFNDRFGFNVPLGGGLSRVFITSTARRWWYDGVYLTADRPYTADSRWGANIAYTYAKAYQNGTDNKGEGIAFGAFDYRAVEDFYKFPGTNDERHRIVASGTVGLPANFRLSSLITLGSGSPYTVFDGSSGFVVRWNEGRPPKQDFILSNAWAYRSVDLRLEWNSPQIANAVRFGIIAEAFNAFDFDNYGSFEQFRGSLNDPRFGQPTGEFNTRRYQLGARLSF